MTRDRYQDQDDFDWVNWELVPLEPKWLYHNIMDKCKKEGIPIRILRVKEEDGKEILVIQKRAEGSTTNYHETDGEGRTI